MASKRTIRIAMSFAIIATSIGIVRVGLWPMDVPRPDSLSTRLLEQLWRAGWRKDGEIPAQSGRNVSWSDGYRFALPTSKSQDAGLRLTLLSTRVRGAKDLNVQTIRDAALGNIMGKTRTVWNGPEEWLMIRPADKPSILVSCYTNGEARSSSDALVQLKIDKDPPNTAASRLRMVLGLQQPRSWGCLLVQFEAIGRAMSETAILKIWSGLKGELLRSE